MKTNKAMLKKVKGQSVIWGVLGAGDVCEKKSAPAMYKTTNSQLKAVMRRNIAKAEDFARRHGVKYWYNDAEKIFGDPEINAVYIATPPDSHAELTIRAAQAGKAVYVEKPMALNYDECKKMVDFCEKAGTPLFVAYYRRALPKFLRIKELLDSNAIGEIRMVQIEMIKTLSPDIIANDENNWRVKPEISGGGYFHDVASHQLDLMDFFFGPVAQAVGISANQAGVYPADDIVTAAFSFGNNILATGNWCFTASKVSEKEITTITGSKGKIEYSTFGDSPIIVDSEVIGKQDFDFVSPEHIEGPMIKLVVDDLLGQALCPCPGSVGARTSKVMDMICSPGKR